MPNGKIIDWQIENIRVTAFVNDKLNTNELEKWLETVSNNSLSQLNKTNSSFLGVSHVSSGFLKVILNSNRLDVVLLPEDLKTNQIIAPLTDLKELFETYFNRIQEIAKVPKIDRVAFGILLTQKVQTDSEGIELIKPHFVGVKPSNSTRDFLYRINIPCISSQVVNAQINRLATWAISRAQVFELAVDQQGNQSQQVVSESEPTVTLELDINTDKDAHLDCNLEVFSKLLYEFQDISLRIASEGEVYLRV